MIRKAGYTQEIRSTAVDHLTREADIIFSDYCAAAKAADLISHGKVPACKDKASYHGRELSD